MLSFQTCTPAGAVPKVGGRFLNATGAPSAAQLAATETHNRTRVSQAQILPTCFVQETLERQGYHVTLERVA